MHLCIRNVSEDAFPNKVASLEFIHQGKVYEMTTYITENISLTNLGQSHYSTIPCLLNQNTDRGAEVDWKWQHNNILLTREHWNLNWQRIFSCWYFKFEHFWRLPTLLGCKHKKKIEMIAKKKNRNEIQFIVIMSGENRENHNHISKTEESFRFRSGVYWKKDLLQIWLHHIVDWSSY